MNLNTFISASWLFGVWGTPGDPYEWIKPIQFLIEDIDPKGRFVNFFGNFSPLWGVRAASVCDCGTHCCEGPISTPSVLSCHTEIVSSAICHIIFPANPPLSLLVLPCLHARSFFLFDGFFCCFFPNLFAQNQKATKAFPWLQWFWGRYIGQILIF